MLVQSSLNDFRTTLVTVLKASLNLTLQKEKQESQDMNMMHGHVIQRLFSGLACSSIIPRILAD